MIYDYYYYNIYFNREEYLYDFKMVKEFIKILEFIILNENIFKYILF
jgi:hypothetical protein